MIENKRYYPQSVFMQSIVEYYQWIEIHGAFYMRTVPNGRVDAWLTVDGSFEFIGKNEGEIIPAHEFGFFPLSENSRDIRVEKKVKTLNIKFLPHVLGFTSLMQLQQSPIPVSFQELFAKEAVASLAKQLKEAASITDIIEVTEQFFEPAFLSGSDADKWLKSILQYMETVPHDEITVSKLAKVAHVSVKTLERRFLKTIGISPKMFCKIIRFQNAVKEIQSKNSRSKTKIPSVSLASGYYDQSHFAKESKHFTGHSPKKMLLHFVAETSDVILQ